MSIDVVITKTAAGTGASKFPAMATGLHAAVIKDVKDLGVRDFGHGPKQSYVAEFVNAKGEEASRFYSPSLFEKSTLAIDLKALDGKIPDTFVMKSLIGRQVQVLVKNSLNKKGYPSAKVTDVMPPAPGQNVAV
jgi:hypothetical protein